MLTTVIFGDFKTTLTGANLYAAFTIRHESWHTVVRHHKSNTCAKRPQVPRQSLKQNHDCRIPGEMIETPSNTTLLGRNLVHPVMWTRYYKS